MNSIRSSQHTPRATGMQNRSRLVTNYRVAGSFPSSDTARKSQGRNPSCNGRRRRTPAEYAQRRHKRWPARLFAAAWSSSRYALRQMTARFCLQMAKRKLISSLGMREVLIYVKTNMLLRHPPHSAARRVHVPARIQTTHHAL